MVIFDPINTYAITGIIITVLVTWFATHSKSETKNNKHKK